MPDQITIERLAPLHPLLRTKILVVIATMEARGIACRVTQGLRTWEEQDALYAQGRTQDSQRRGEKIVTNARGGFSSHNFGLAVDLVPELIPGGAFDPDWQSGDDHYKAMQQAARDQGLVCGADWRSLPDPPHFQLAGVPVTPSNEMRELYKTGGLQAVWDVVKA